METDALRPMTEIQIAQTRDFVDSLNEECQTYWDMVEVGDELERELHITPELVILYADGETHGFSAMPTGWEESFTGSTRQTIRAVLDGEPPCLTGRQGIDVFCSERDWVTLGVGVTIVGTTDRRWAAAAGRVGFRPVLSGPQDEALYAKLPPRGDGDRRRHRNAVLHRGP